MHYATHHTMQLITQCDSSHNATHHTMQLITQCSSCSIDNKRFDKEARDFLICDVKLYKDEKKMTKRAKNNALGSQFCLRQFCTAKHELLESNSLLLLSMAHLW